MVTRPAQADFFKAPPPFGAKTFTHAIVSVDRLRDAVHLGLEAPAVTTGARWEREP